MSWPLSFLTAKRLPAQSGKYTASPSTVGVAETSPPVVNTHFGIRSLTLAGLMECSAGWLQVLLRFCPAIRHWPDRNSCEWFCAGTAEADRTIMVNTIVTIVGSDQFSRPKLRKLQTFIGFCLLILVKKLVAPAFESEIQKDGFPYVLRRKYAHNPEDGL